MDMESFSPHEEPQRHGAEEVSPGQQLCEQECRISLGQENPEPTLVVKEEKEEFRIITVESLKTEPEGEGYGGPGPTSDSLLHSVVEPDSADGEKSSGLLQSCSVMLKCLKMEIQSPKREIKTELQSHCAEEEVPLSQLCEQECRISLGQENPEPTVVKEEQEELWATKEEEQLPGMDSDTNDLALTSCDKTVFYQVLNHPTRLHLTHPVNNEAEAQIKTEPEGEGYGGPGPTSDFLLLSVNPESTDRVESSGLLQTVLKPLNPGRTKRNMKQISPTSTKDRRGEQQLDDDDMMMMHTGARRFQCKDCGKGYIRKQHLNKHMMIHTGARPFKCKDCGKGYSTKRSLNRHMMVHTGTKLNV